MYRPVRLASRAVPILAALFIVSGGVSVSSHMKSPYASALSELVATSTYASPTCPDKVCSGGKCVHLTLYGCMAPQGGDCRSHLCP